MWVCEVGPQFYRCVDVTVNGCVADAGMKDWLHVGFML